MKHRKLLIGTSIGCAVLLAGAALYVGCSSSRSSARKGSRVSAHSEDDKDNLRAPGSFAGDNDADQAAKEKLGAAYLLYGEDLLSGYPSRP
ncbi:MAG: hypothetical protein IH895_06850, partial [Planctomycetes bacterium]|nr:hypothetical protein [Planctomycetota bacterium]